MSTAMRYTQNALFLEYTVASGDTATEGEASLLDSDTTTDDCDGASDLAVGVNMSTQVAGAQVELCMFGWAVCPVKVGTGGATRGTKAKLVGDGFTDATTHDSDGVGNESTYGIFLQSGTAGQFVGLLLSGAANRGV